MHLQQAYEFSQLLMQEPEDGEGYKRLVGELRAKHRRCVPYGEEQRNTQVLNQQLLGSAVAAANAVVALAASDPPAGGASSSGGDNQQRG